MQALLGYHARMRRWAALSALSFAVALTPSASAQINGVAPSVTSYGFGNHTQPNAPRASVTSLGPNGFNGPRFSGGFVPPGRPTHDHRHTYPFYPAYYPYYPVIDPYVYSGPVDGGPGAANDDDQYQGGPTIFDRRGNGERYASDYRPPAPPRDSQMADASVPAPHADAAPEPSQPDTVLVFKDGHKQEVSNYAIVGGNLFDLSSGRHQKIALTDLDVAETQKANEKNGIDFKLPSLPAGG